MKRLLVCVLLAWAVAPFASFAQYTAAVLEINSKDGVYAVGDSIKVWAKVSADCAPVQEFMVQEDMLRDIRKEELKLTPGRHLVYADVCSKPVNYVFSFGEPGADRNYKKEIKFTYFPSEEVETEHVLLLMQTLIKTNHISRVSDL